MGEALLARARRAARRLKREVVALWFAARDPRTPWLARLVAAAVAAYALSPIDLIPDVIPGLGLLDDFLLVPLGILLALRLIPPDVMAEARAKAEAQADRPVSRAGLIVIVTIWLSAAGGFAWWILSTA
ncbi:YkvA family protein [Rhizobium sp. YIM 134829]|uniref:YkvA family protein n=1 Tax=Rhizobium sp. YIM 134829 TaxID=3390453 RepID=UPI00397C4BEF